MFAPHDWYWLADDKRVYSSKRQLIVDDTDAEYLEWAEYTPATPWPTDADGNQTEEAMQEKVAPYGQFVTLAFYTADVRYKKSISNITVNGLPFATDPVTMMSLNAAYIYTIDKQINAFSWKLPDGSFVTLDTEGVKDLQACVAGYGQACFTCEDDTLTAIETGTITDRAGVDAAFDAVQTSFTGLMRDSTKVRHGPKK